MCAVAAATSASAQTDPGVQPRPVSRIAALPYAELDGIVIDNHGAPLEGVVVSALGSTTAFVVSDREGRFTFHKLQYGPYLLRAHLEGYQTARARAIQINQPLHSVPALELTRRHNDDEDSVLTAGLVEPVTSGTTESGAATDDHSEVAWRLRHLNAASSRRSRQE
jgi:hypothetical protein